MALTSGTNLGPYEIRSPLGGGGMGEVYRARDRRLGRDVAIKVLPVTFARDSERMSRFQREAQVLAVLNHPNIAAIYGLEDSGTQALIMEFVDGPTLADRIALGPLPKEEAVSLATQIAEALEYAHERGVIHRDLKPANIKLTADGRVKILDFGLAKVLMGDASAIDSSSSPTFTSLATQAGVIIGTAAYMSPEQAKGKPVDSRTDIWAFGCVLYEMLCGKQAFHGETATDTLAAIIRAQPEWAKLPTDTPAEIRRFLERCLRKDPKMRLQAIGDARITLDELQNPAELESTSIPATTAPRIRFQHWAVFAGVVLLAAAASGLIGWQLRGTPEQPLVKFNIPMQNQDWLYACPRISPDGKKIVYRADNELWIRELSQLSPRAVPDTTGAVVPFWSPDSSEIAYFKDQRLWKVPISGGGATAITAFEGFLSGGSGADWGPNDEIIFTTGQDAVYGVSAKSGSPRAIVTPDRHTELDLHDPHFLPDGRSILIVPHAFAGGPDSIDVFTNGTRKQLLRVEGTRLMEPVYSASGHIFFRREGDRPGLWAVPFSLSKLQVTGDPFLIAPDAGTPTLSEQTLAYLDHVEISRFQLAWFDTSGKMLEAVGSPELIFYDPKISPDGRLIAVSTRRTGKLGIWILDILRGTLSPLSSGSGAMRFPVWSPDGRSLTYVSTGAEKIGEQHLLRARAGSSGEEEVLGEGTDPAYSPDGRSLFYAVGDKTKGFQLRLMELEGGHTSRTLYYSNARLSNPVPSPDGLYFAFVSAESGREEVYLKPVSGNEGKLQVSNKGGTAPRWSKAGDRLLYAEGAAIVEVGIRSHLGLTLSAPRKLLTLPSELKGDYGFDMTGDGRRFLFVSRADANQSAPVNLTVVQNWFAEFKDRQK